MTNADYKELSESEKEEFLNSVEDPDTLTKGQRADYDALFENGSEEAKGFSFAKAAEEFFETTPSYPHASVIVVSDGSIFEGTLKGKNLCDNHLALNNAKGLSTKEINREEE